MPAPLTKVGLANRALAAFGAGALQTFDQSAAPGPTVALVYDTVIDGLLSEYPWSFTKSTQALTQISETAQTDGYLIEGWRYAYGLPSNLLCLPEKYLPYPTREDAPLQRFEVQNQTVYCDLEQLWAVCRVRADESVWPPYFVRAAVAVLAAELCMPISGNSGLLQQLEAKAWGTPQEDRTGGLLGLARRADARGAGTRLMPRDPLTDAHFA